MPKDLRTVATANIVRQTLAASGIAWGYDPYTREFSFGKTKGGNAWEQLCRALRDHMHHSAHLASDAVLDELRSQLEGSR